MRWRYKTLRVLRDDREVDAVSNLQDVLNVLSADGWGIVSVLPFTNRDFVIVARKRGSRKPGKEK